MRRHNEATPRDDATVEPGEPAPGPSAMGPDAGPQGPPRTVPPEVAAILNALDPFWTRAITPPDADDESPGAPGHGPGE